MLLLRDCYGHDVLGLLSRLYISQKNMGVSLRLFHKRLGDG